jgi:3-hydroxyacyl-CoA dehydrogenase
LCETGRLGRKAGGRWYHNEGGKPVSGPEVETVILLQSERLGFVRRPFSAQDIMDRITDVMRAEASTLLAEGIAESAGDIDVAMILGFGFPRHRGGPMFLVGEEP